MTDHNDLINFLQKGQSIDLPFFEGYTFPQGYLTPDKESHACFFYYLNARKAYETYELNTPIIYEDQKDPEVNFRELFKNTARMYGIAPESMSRCWEQVDKQCQQLGLPLLPNRYKFIQQKIILG